MDIDGYSLIRALPLVGSGVLALLLIGVAAAAEISFASVNRTQLRQLLGGRKLQAQAAEALLAEPVRLLSTLLLVKVTGALLAAASALLLAQRLGLQAYLVWWLVGAGVALILVQLSVRAWAIGHEERWAVALTPLIRLLALLLSPVTAVMQRIGRGALPEGRAVESIFLSEDGLRFLLNASDEEAGIEEEEKELIASIFEFGDKLVREVMVPRIDVSAVPVDMPMLEALDIILKAGHSRIPVYRHSIDNVVGILYAKDLLRYLRDGRTDVPLDKILRAAYFIPESKKVDELLQELQQRKVHMAVVVDEYGGTAGLVTIEDLLEEIVGEIQDEFDAEEPTVEALGEQQYIFDARVPLAEVDKLLEIQLPTEGGDTLGGFIYSQLGKVPAVGDRIAFGAITFEVLSVAGRRIKQVRARQLDTDEVTSASSKPLSKVELVGSNSSAGLLAFLSLY